MLPADTALMERLGARIRELRERAKLSQDALGERAGFSGKYIGEIEKGIRDVPVSTLRAVVEAGLGLRIESVLGESATRRLTPSSVPLARDVEVTASALAALPLRVRRPLFALVDALKADVAQRAAEPSARWKPGRARSRSK